MRIFAPLLAGGSGFAALGRRVLAGRRWAVPVVRARGPAEVAACRLAPIRAGEWRGRAPRVVQWPARALCPASGYAPVARGRFGVWWEGGAEPRARGVNRAVQAAGEPAYTAAAMLGGTLLGREVNAHHCGEQWFYQSLGGGRVLQDFLIWAAPPGPARLRNVRLVWCSGVRGVVVPVGGWHSPPFPVPREWGGTGAGITFWTAQSAVHSCEVFDAVRAADALLVARPPARVAPRPALPGGGKARAPASGTLPVCVKIESPRKYLPYIHVSAVSAAP